MRENFEASNVYPADNQEIKVIVSQFQCLGFAVSSCFISSKLNAATLSVLTSSGTGRNGRLMSISSSIHNTEVMAAGSISLS